MDEEETPGPVLATSIFLIPHIFGWLVFLPGYSLLTRMVVIVYMVMTAIPLYFLMATLMGTQGDDDRFSTDFYENRALADENANEAKSYMDDYYIGGLSSKRNNAAQGTGIVQTNASEIASQAEKNPDFDGQFGKKTVKIKGQLIAIPSGKVAYLKGTEYYPAVTLEYSDSTPDAETNDEIMALCVGVEKGISGPKLKECKQING